MNRPRKARVVAISALVLTVLAGCSSSDPAASPDPSDTPYAASLSLSDVDLHSTIGISSDIPGLLPNHEFEILGGNYAANSQVVLEGEPVKIEPERAVVWDAKSEEGDGSTVAFDDPAAQSRSWIVAVRIARTVAGAEPAGVLPDAVDADLVKVRLRSAGGKVDEARYESGILGLGRSVWFLTSFPDGPRDAFGIAWFGGAVASVSPAGTLEFKLLPPERRKEIDENSYSVDKLVELAAAPVTRIPRDEE